MNLRNSPDGRKVIELESWEEAGIKIIVPRPKRIDDELARELQKISIELTVKMGEDVDLAGLDTLTKVIVRPIYCPHGHPESIDVTLECDAPAVHFSYLVFPFDDHLDSDDPEDLEDNPDYDDPPREDGIEDGG